MIRYLIALTVLTIAYPILNSSVVAQRENRLLLGYWEPVDEEDHMLVHVYEDENGAIEGRVIEADRTIDGYEHGINSSNNIIISGFHHDEDYIWREGEIHDPEDGDTYSGRLTLMHSSKIEVRAYWAIFSKDMTWRKVDAPTITASSDR